jgi:hypothetical protein
VIWLVLIGICIIVWVSSMSSSSSSASATTTCRPSEFVAPEKNKSVQPDKEMEWRSDYGRGPSSFGRKLLADLPEAGFMAKGPGISKIELLNAVQIELSYKENEALISIEVIRRDYAFTKRDRVLGLSNVMLRKDEMLVNLEDEAMNYFTEQGLTSFRNVVESKNHLINIFALAAYAGNDSEILEEIRKHARILALICESFEPRDIAMFARYLIGMPDLSVIDSRTRRHFFSEVKARRDILRVTQKAWFLKNFVDYQPNSRYSLLKILPANNDTIIQTSIVGLRYRCTSDYLGRISNGDRLEIARDFGNPHDELAVKVINRADKKHLGFISREFNRQKGIWKLVEEGRFIDCYVETAMQNPSSYANSHHIDIAMVFQGNQRKAA